MGILFFHHLSHPLNVCKMYGKISRSSRGIMYQVLCARQSVELFPDSSMDKIDVLKCQKSSFFKKRYFQYSNDDVIGHGQKVWHDTKMTPICKEINGSYLKNIVNIATMSDDEVVAFFGPPQSLFYLCGVAPKPDIIFLRSCAIFLDPSVKGHFFF